MKAGQNVLLLALVTLLWPTASYARAADGGRPSDSAKAFLGRWDVTLKAPDREYPSWLEITEPHGKLQVRMVGRWGHARVLPKAEVKNGQITFVSPK